MDFHALSRKDLQALCKKNRIPANTTNVAMADALQALKSVEGLAEILDSAMLQSPKTNQKSTAPKSKIVDQASPLPRSRRVSAKPPVMDDEDKKKEMSEAPSLVNTRRRASKKGESKGILGTTVGRRTRQTAKKEVCSEAVTTEVRRSTRVKGIKMSPLSKEDDEEKVDEAEKLEVEAEKKSDEKEQINDLKADAQLKSEEGKVVEAEIVVLQSKGDGNVVEKELEEEKAECQEEPNEEKVIPTKLPSPLDCNTPSNDLKAEYQEEPKEEKVVPKAEDPVEEITVENKDEDEAIAEEKQETVMENIVDHVEEVLLEDKEDDKAIDEEAEQEETVYFSIEQDSAKIVVQEMAVHTKHNDKEETVMEETLVENKEEEKAINEEAKQEAAADYKTEQENAKIVIEEMKIPVETKHEETVVENVVDHVEETLVENKEDQLLLEEEAKQEAFGFKTEQEGNVDHVVETLEASKEEDGAIDEEAKQEETTGFETEQESIKIVIEEMNIPVGTKHKEEAVIENVVGNAEETLVENKEEDELIDEKAKQETFDFKTEQESIIVNHAEETLVVNKEEDAAMNEEVKQDDAFDFKTEQMENKEEDKAINDSIMENIIDHVEEKLMVNKEEDEAIAEETEQEEAIDCKTEQNSAKIAIEEMNISVDRKHNDKEQNVEGNVASVEEKIVEDHVFSVGLEAEEHVMKENVENNDKEENVEDNVASVEEKIVEDDVFSEGVEVEEHAKEENFEDNVASVEEKIVEDLVVSVEVYVEEHASVNEDSPIKGLITSNSKTMNAEIIEEAKIAEMASDEVNEVEIDNGEFSIHEFSDKPETYVSKIEIVELAKSDLNFKPRSGSNSNKENANQVSVQVNAKSNVVNYENLSLRKLKSAYREMVAMKSKGEEKRTALKAVNENCI